MENRVCQCFLEMDLERDYSGQVWFTNLGITWGNIGYNDDYHRDMTPRGSLCACWNNTITGFTIFA